MNIFNTSINITIILILIIIASIHYKNHSDYLSYLICVGAIFAVICMATYKYAKEYIQPEEFYGDAGMTFQDYTRASLDIYNTDSNKQMADKNGNCGGLCVNNITGNPVPNIQSDYDYNILPIKKYIYLYFFREYTYSKDSIIYHIKSGLVYIDPIYDNHLTLANFYCIITEPYSINNKWIVLPGNFQISTPSTASAASVSSTSRNIIFFGNIFTLDTSGNIISDGNKIGKWKYSKINYIDGKNWIVKDTSLPPIIDTKYNEIVTDQYNVAVIENKCDMAKIITGTYAIIGPDSKYLSFDASGIDTDIFTSPGPTSFCDSVMPNEYVMKSKKVKGNKSTLNETVVYNFENPQLWTIKLSDTKLNNCAVFICTYSKNTDKPIYYLTAHQDGTLTMSLFGGAGNQMWYLEYIDKNTLNELVISVLIANIDSVFDSYKTFSDNINTNTYLGDSSFPENCMSSQYGCCPGELTKAKNTNRTNCTNKCISLSNKKLEDAKKKALDILRDTSKDVSTKLDNINNIIYENKYNNKLYFCSPCYKKIIDAYAPKGDSLLNNIYHIKSAKYGSYLVSDINGYTHIDFDNVFLTGQKDSSRTIWTAIQ